jgi:antagonist of KipI
MRAYLAVAGGFEALLVLGSRATDVRSRLGGLKGRPLRDGDVLFVAAGPGAPSTKPRYVTAPPHLVHPLLVEEGGNAAPPHRLRIERGPYPTAVADRQFDQLISSTFIVSPQSDRMGYRLSGSPLEGDTVSMISMPTVTGLVQVPPSGEPILLMADRQTTGGYSPVAVVIAADLPLAGQLGPGDTLCFDPCDAAAALQALIAQERALLALERE